MTNQKPSPDELEVLLTNYVYNIEPYPPQEDRSCPSCNKKYERLCNREREADDNLWHKPLYFCRDCRTYEFGSDFWAGH
jgi:hypothetical protein